MPTGPRYHGPFDPCDDAQLAAKYKSERDAALRELTEVKSTLAIIHKLNKETSVVLDGAIAVRTEERETWRRKGLQYAATIVCDNCNHRVPFAPSLEGNEYHFVHVGSTSYNSRRPCEAVRLGILTLEPHSHIPNFVGGY